MEEATDHMEKNKKRIPIVEQHEIKGKWLTYYVLNGNADTFFSKINLNNVKIFQKG